jgi:P2 family phage contractile tail tube protein
MPYYPAVLKQYNCYAQQTKLIGLADVTLPKVTWVKDPLKGANISGELNLSTPGNVTAMEATFNFHADSHPALELFTGQAQQINCKSSILGMDTGSFEMTEKAEECAMVLLSSGFDLGKRDTSTKALVVITFDVLTVQLVFDGVVYWGIDPMNGSCIVNGVDINAQTKANT